MPRAQALSEILFQNFRSFRSPLAFSPFLKTTAAKQHTPSTRRSGKNLVTGRTCSTTAQAYSLSSLPPCQLSHAHFCLYSTLVCSVKNPSLFLPTSTYHFLPPSSCWLLLQASISHSVPFRSSSPTQLSLLAALLKPTPSAFMKIRRHFLHTTHTKKKNFMHTMQD